MRNSIIFFLLIIATTLYAYVDSDMDGVEDGQDRCPNTSFTDLVDINGCTKESLVSNHHYDIIAGASFADSNYQTLEKRNTYSSSFQIDYYYKEFSLQLSSAYFTSKGSNYSESGMYDTFVGGAYQFNPSSDLRLRLSAGLLLPTYKTSLNNNNTDYNTALNLSYSLENFNIFGGVSYTIINDDDYRDSNLSVNYQDTLAYNFGAGYSFNNNLYMSLNYSESSSIYKDIENIESLSLYGSYSFDEHWFSTFSYAYGLSESASNDFASLRLGYYF